MDYQNLTLPEIKIIGIKIITQNSKELSANGGQIAKTVSNYFSNQLMNQITNRINPGVTYCLYTDYESDQNGKYSFIIGEEVNSLRNIPANFVSHIIPKQKYCKLTSEQGPIPSIVVDLWKKIWSSEQAVLGVKRTFTADFELYDQRAGNPQNAIMDLFIAIE